MTDPSMRWDGRHPRGAKARNRGKLALAARMAVIGERKFMRGRVILTGLSYEDG